MNSFVVRILVTSCENQLYRVYFIQSKWYIQLTIFIVSSSLLEQKSKEQSSFDHV